MDTFILVATIYLLLVLVLTLGFNYLERKLSIPGFESS